MGEAASAAIPSLSVDISALLCDSPDPHLVGVVIQQLRAAADHYGYAHVVGHGVPSSVMERLLRLCRMFFESKHPIMAVSENDPIAMRNSPNTYRGYQPLAYNVTEGAPDAHHALDYMRSLGVSAAGPGDSAFFSTSENTRNDSTLNILLKNNPQLAALAFGQNIFPDERFAEAVQDFVPYALRAGVAVMNAVATALELPAHALRDAFSDPFWILRLIHYPAEHQAGNDQTTDHCRSSNSTAMLGCGAHRDYGFLTFLVEQSVEKQNSALQVSLREGCWTSARVPAEGALLLNFGDCREVISGGVFPATLHRVLRPARGDRLSIACFVEPNFAWSMQSLLPTDQRRSHRQCQTAHDEATYSGRLANLTCFSCYGEYLLSKVQTNFTVDETK